MVGSMCYVKSLLTIWDTLGGVSIQQKHPASVPTGWGTGGRFPLAACHKFPVQVEENTVPVLWQPLQMKRGLDVPPFMPSD